MVVTIPATGIIAAMTVSASETMGGGNTVVHTIVTGHRRMMKAAESMGIGAMQVAHAVSREKMRMGAAHATAMGQGCVVHASSVNRRIVDCSGMKVGQLMGSEVAEMRVSRAAVVARDVSVGSSHVTIEVRMASATAVARKCVASADVAREMVSSSSATVAGGYMRVPASASTMGVTAATVPATARMGMASAPSVSATTSVVTSSLCGWQVTKKGRQRKKGRNRFHDKGVFLIWAPIRTAARPWMVAFAQVLIGNSGSVIELVLIDKARNSPYLFKGKRLS